MKPVLLEAAKAYWTWWFHASDVISSNFVLLVPGEYGLLGSFRSQMYIFAEWSEAVYKRRTHETYLAVHGSRREQVRLNRVEVESAYGASMGLVAQHQ